MSGKRLLQRLKQEKLKPQTKQQKQRLAQIQENIAADLASGVITLGLIGAIALAAMPAIASPKSSPRQGIPTCLNQPDRNGAMPGCR